MSDFKKEDVGFLQVGCRMSDFNKPDVGSLQVGYRMSDFLSRMSDGTYKLPYYRVLPYILLRNTTLLFPKWRQKPTRPILRYSSVVNMEMCKIINFENS